MIAIILAAGQGKRLLPLTSNLPNCLLNVGGKSILEYQIDICKKLGLQRIFVVVGFNRQLIEKKLSNSVRYIFNKNYATTNSLYSFWLTKDYLSDDVLILNSDVLFHEKILKLLLSADEKNILAAEFRNTFSCEDMKIRADHEHRLIEISKDIQQHEAMAENLGMVRLSKECARFLILQINPIIQSTARNKWFPYGLNLICDRRCIKCLDITGLPWIEIDFIHDYERARKLILPQLMSQSDWKMPKPVTTRV